MSRGEVGRVGGFSPSRSTLAARGLLTRQLILSLVSRAVVTTARFLRSRPGTHYPPCHLQACPALVSSVEWHPMTWRAACLVVRGEQNV